MNGDTASPVRAARSASSDFLPREQRGELRPGPGVAGSQSDHLLRRGGGFVELTLLCQDRGQREQAFDVGWILTDGEFGVVGGVLDLVGLQEVSGRIQ